MEPSTEYTGKFQMTDSENFDAFMGALGIGYLTRCSITFRQTLTFSEFLFRMLFLGCANLPENLMENHETYEKPF